MPTAVLMICLHFLFCFSRQPGEMSIFLVFGFRMVKLLAEGHIASKCLSQDANAIVLALNHCATLPCCLIAVHQD